MDSKKIGNFVRELREEAGMSQTDLANKVYVASSVVSRWESGKATISAHNLILLSELFHISLDELVAGHRFDKKVEEEKKEVLVGVISSNQKTRLFAKRLMHIIIVLLIIFLGYLVYNFYNSIQLYSIHMDTDKYNIQYGMLTKTRDRLYFHLDIDYNENEDNIESVSIYHNNDKDKQLIIKSSNINSLNFVDYYGYEEYIKFSEFNKIINNLYLEIQYKDTNVENYKLSFDRTYANIDFFLKKNRNIDENASPNETKEFDEKITKVRDILSKHKDYLEVKYDGVNYEIFKTFDGFDISFNENNKSYIFNYNALEFVYFSRVELENKKRLISYRINVNNNNCVEGSCEKFSGDYEIFKKLIDYIIDSK